MQSEPLKLGWISLANRGKSDDCPCQLSSGQGDIRRFITLEFLPGLLQGRLDQVARLRMYVFGNFIERHDALSRKE